MEFCKIKYACPLSHLCSFRDGVTNTHPCSEFPVSHLDRMTWESLSLNFFVFLDLDWHGEGSMDFMFWLSSSLLIVQSVWERAQGRSVTTLLLFDVETLTLTSALTFSIKKEVQLERRLSS